MRPARYHLSVRAARAGALFTSVLQRSAEPTTGQVRRAVADAVHAFGSRGCAEPVAQEFGDHPQTAAARMRWARAVTGQAFGTGVVPASTDAAATNDLPGATGADRGNSGDQGVPRLRTASGPDPAARPASGPGRPRRVSRLAPMRELHNSITESDIRPKG